MWALRNIFLWESRKINLLMQFESEGKKSWRSFANKEDGMMISGFVGVHEKLCG